MLFDIKILDGGFSSQLSTHVSKKIDGDPLWTARFLKTDPDAVYATHLDFLRAGSDIIETNTYQASIPGFVKYLNVIESESIDLIHEAAHCAKRALDKYEEESGQRRSIAGSCGPYGAALHDCSEYTGKYGDVPQETIKNWHRPRVKALLESGIDLLALETIPCRQEAEALIDLLKEFPNAKAWMSFSCRDDGKSIADGSNFQEVALNCYKNALPGQIVAIGVNCIGPENVTPLFKGINNKSEADFIPLVVYPNSGEKYTEGEWKKSEGYYDRRDEFIEEWLDMGVRYIGGCCRVYANDIQRIRIKVEEWKSNSIKNEKDMH